MKYSAKFAPPPEMLDWLKVPDGSEWQPTYADFRGLPKTSAHETLLKEQGYVCCYCGRGLKSDRTDSHIDHYWPQKHFNRESPPDRTLDYNNFFASCGPPGLPLERRRHPGTCGDAKGNLFNRELYIMPSDEDCEIRFLYSPNGIVSTAANDTAASLMIEVLDLNHESLQYEREVMIKAIEEDILNKKLLPEDFENEITHWRTRDTDGRLRSFGHVAARYIEDEASHIIDA